MNNYEFCAQWVCGQIKEGGARILDYGCGGGEILRELESRNVHAFGCDVFYAGGDYSASLDTELFENGRVRRMTDHVIPFESRFFDVVVNNQVMEHVEDLDIVLSEIHRVLRPGGVVLNLFPDKGVWREGHCGIPFLHWFPKRSRTRIRYAAILRILGFGYHKEGKGVMQWSREFCVWLDQWTYYRKRSEIDRTYRRYFGKLLHVEEYWLQERLDGKMRMILRCPASCQGYLVRKLMGLVFVASRPK